MAWSLARFPADSEGPPRCPDEEGQERAEQAPVTRGVGRPLARELLEGPGSLFPGSRFVRIGTLVEGWWGLGHHRPSGGRPEAGEPGGATYLGSLQDY